MAVSKKKKGRNLILLLILMIVMIGAIFFVTNQKKEKESSKTDTSEDTSVIAKTDTTAIKTIHFNTPENDMILIVNEQGNWQNYLDEKFPVNQTHASNMASAFANITATRTMTEGISDLSEFGLTKPAATITATLKDESAIKVKIGDKVPVSGGYYATLNDDGKVYIIPDSFYATFDYTLAQMTEVEKIPAITAENITKLSVVNKEKSSFEVVYEEESPADLSGFSNYVINKPYATPVPADSDSVIKLFGNYSAMTFSSCVDYNGADLSKYGLDKPTKEIHIRYYEEETKEAADTNATKDSDSIDTAKSTGKVEHELTLYIGAMNENGDYYAKLKDSNAVNIISASTVSTLTDIVAYDNTYKYINLINLDTVDSIDIKVEDTTYHLAIKRETKTVDGKETQAASYYVNDKKLEEDAFKTLYQKIIAPVTEREIPKEGTTQANIPYMTVTYQLNTSKEPLVISYIPYDQSYDIVNTNGVQNFLTDIRKITEITDSLKTYK